jgi:hypothetical protein|tara:strand:- start:984 stop:1133 length:150 start_codon:yes stop_codon:yes gene_type:complete
MAEKKHKCLTHHHFMDEDGKSWSGMNTAVPKTRKALMKKKGPIIGRSPA